MIFLGIVLFVTVEKEVVYSFFILIDNKNKIISAMASGNVKRKPS